MPIKFHCENCKRKIKAPDESGGKYGNCPYCNHRCYIPRPRLDDEDDLQLAPVDDKEETRYEELMSETHSVTENILQQRQKPAAPGQREETNKKELTKNIVIYLRQIADGELDEAQKTVDAITPYREQAIKILDEIGAREVPEPELADISPVVLNRLIKNLRTRMS